MINRKFGIRTDSILLLFTMLPLLVGFQTARAQETVAMQSETQEYIVVFEDQYSAYADQFRSKAGLRDAASRTLKAAKEYQEIANRRRQATSVIDVDKNELGYVYFHLLKGFSASLTTDAVNSLRDRPEIRIIVPDVKMYGAMTQLLDSDSWGLDRIDQRNLPLDQAYKYQSDGAGVHAYVFDSGIRATHDEFVGRVGNGYDFIDNDSDPSDCAGHGTHVSGTIGGTSYGVAKNIIIHPVRMLNCQGEGQLSQWAAAVDWVVDNYQQPAVANMSLRIEGSPGLFDLLPLLSSITIMSDLNIVTVVAAGNDNADACGQPLTTIPGVISVGAITFNDQRASFSNYGECVDIFAPGESILSAGIGGDNYAVFADGTSMATPHVTGVAATYLALHPGASSAEVAGVIMSNATSGVVSLPGPSSPNRLLYSNFIDAPLYDLAWLVPVVNLILL